MTDHEFDFDWLPRDGRAVQVTPLYRDEYGWVEAVMVQETSGAFQESPEVWIRLCDEAGGNGHPIKLDGSYGITELRKVLDAIESRVCEVERAYVEQPGLDAHLDALAREFA